ncbi:MAG: putative ATPase [Arcobacteraceae bacterium]|jgi:predicted ATPase
MNLTLENIGIIKKADITFDGLTVLAGENDTGKSTVSKVLYSIIKSTTKDGKFSKYNLINNFQNYFNSDISTDGQIIFEQDKLKIDIEIKDNNFVIENSDTDTCFWLITNGSPTAIFIETPLIWNLMELLTKLPMIEDSMEIELAYPKIMKDLHFNLSFKSKRKGLDIAHRIFKIIHGGFLKNNDGSYYFQRDDKKVQLINTATGIKYFGILQVLSINNHLYDGQILILDEPEVHLHPKWQLKLAELIIDLVKNGVKIVVNSHSPYMIEALQRYSEKEQIEDKTNYYLAQDGVIGKIENSNNRTLSEIFEKLSEPYDVFEKMESDRF